MGDIMPKMKNGHHTLIIGIAGGTGSGKTTIAQELMKHFSNTGISYISHDNYYKDLSKIPPKERKAFNFDHPDSLESKLLASHLSMLKSNEKIQIPIYDFKTHTRTDKTITVEPNPVIIVEGILVLASTEIVKLLDTKIFVDTDDDIRLIRRTQRDIKQRGRTVEGVFQQWQKTVRPMHMQFVEPSKRNADLIIPEGRNDAAISMLIAAITSQINSNK